MQFSYHIFREIVKYALFLLSVFQESQYGRGKIYSAGFAANSGIETIDHPRTDYVAGETSFQFSSLANRFGI
jgi:hypothetical protein